MPPRLLRRRRGASATEYGLLLGLLAVGLIGAAWAVGQRDADIFCKAGGAISAENPRPCTQPLQAPPASEAGNSEAGGEVPPATPPATALAFTTPQWIRDAISGIAPDSSAAYVSLGENDLGETTACVRQGIVNNGSTALSGYSVTGSGIQLCAPDTPSQLVPEDNALPLCGDSLAPGAACAIGLRSHLAADATPGSYRLPIALSAPGTAGERGLIVGLAWKRVAIAVPDIEVTRGTASEKQPLTLGSVPAGTQLYFIPAEAATPSEYCCGVRTERDEDGRWQVWADLSNAETFPTGDYRPTLRFNDYASFVRGESPPFTVTVEAPPPPPPPPPPHIAWQGYLEQPPEEAVLQAEAVFGGSGQGSACVLLPGGKPLCWGLQDIVLPDDLTGVASLALTDEAVCTLKDGGVTCWGNGHQPQFPTDYTPPAGLSSGVDRLIGGNNDFCALQGGAAICWGRRASYPVTQWPLPAAFASGLDDLALGSGAVCGLKGGVPVCADSGGHAIAVPAISGASAIDVDDSIGAPQACVIVGGAVQCWGWDYGWTLSAQSALNAVPAAAQSGVSRIALGFDQACALSGGTATCWGAGAYGEQSVADVPAIAIAAGRTVSLQLLPLP